MKITGFRYFLVVLACLVSYPAIAAEFLHPMDFDGSDAHKKQVIEYIKKTVHKDYCKGAVDMCNDVTLRMMEKQNMRAFKKAITYKDRKIMDRVVSDYCSGAVNMCNYVTIDMMYKQNLKASKKELKW